MTALSAEKMIRKQFLLPAATVRRLEKIAAARGTSVSEIVRRAMDSFDADGAEAMEFSELMDLVSQQLKEAIKSTRSTQRAVSNSLNALSARN